VLNDLIVNTHVHAMMNDRSIDVKRVFISCAFCELTLTVYRSAVVVIADVWRIMNSLCRLEGFISCLGGKSDRISSRILAYTNRRINNI
jgi:hypothetical protein